MIKQTNKQIFSRTTIPILTKVDTMILEYCSNEGQPPSPMVDNGKRFLLSSYPELAVGRPNSIKIGTCNPW
jgi:hypothetical protein